jgi:hypothetical protein
MKKRLAIAFGPLPCPSWTKKAALIFIVLHQVGRKPGRVSDAFGSTSSSHGIKHETSLYHENLDFQIPETKVGTEYKSYKLKVRKMALNIMKNKHAVVT